MGVSAVFVSALARTRLPVPAYPPENQAQFLAAVIQPIVTFVVLGSIIVRKSFVSLVFRVTIGASYAITDGLSIPSFNLGRGVQSLTLSYTWTRTRTGPTIPDWVFYARRPENNTAVDVERGVETGGETASAPEGRPNQTDNGLPSAAEVVNPVPLVVNIIGKDAGIGSVDEATEPTKVCSQFC